MITLWRSTSFFRLSIAALASAAAFLIALPSPFGEASWGYGDWSLAPTKALANIAAWGACALALAMAWRLPQHPASRPLALFLSLVALAFGFLSAPALLDARIADRAMLGMGLASSVLAVAALVRFSVSFPRPLIADEMLSIWRTWGRRAFGKLPQVIVPLSAAVAFVVLTGAVAGVSLTALGVVTVGFCAFAGFTSTNYLRTGYRLSSGEQRQRVLWIPMGFGLALYTIIFGWLVPDAAGLVGWYAEAARGFLPYVSDYAAIGPGSLSG